MFFRVKDNIAGRGDEPVARKGDRVSRAQLPGCDIAWLVRCGAIELEGGAAGASLLSDDPSKEELVEEISRLHTVVEEQAKALDSQQNELRELRELRDRAVAERLSRGPLVPGPSAGAELSGHLAGEAESLRDRTRAQDATIASLGEQLAAARDRADKYTARLSELERENAAIKDQPPATPAPPAPPAAPVPPSEGK